VGAVCKTGLTVMLKRAIWNLILTMRTTRKDSCGSGVYKGITLDNYITRISLVIVPYIVLKPKLINDLDLFKIIVIVLFAYPWRHESQTSANYYLY
jgi:hypothetical protein